MRGVDSHPDAPISAPMKRVPEPNVEKKGRTERRAGQRDMQRRAAAAVMALREGRSDDERKLLAKVAEAVVKLEVRD